MQPSGPFPRCTKSNTGLIGGPFTETLGDSGAHSSLRTSGVLEFYILSVLWNSTVGSPLEENLHHHHLRRAKKGFFSQLPALIRTFTPFNGIKENIKCLLMKRLNTVVGTDNATVTSNQHCLCERQGQDGTSLDRKDTWTVRLLLTLCLTLQIIPTRKKKKSWLSWMMRDTCGKEIPHQPLRRTHTWNYGVRARRVLTWFNLISQMKLRSGWWRDLPNVLAIKLSLPIKQHQE